MEHAFSHGSTFAPNELAMAAGLATLHELDEQGLVERSARLGERLLELTRPLVERYDVVRDVRGLGLMWAIEFGEPAAARSVVPAARAAAARALRAARRRAALPDHRILSQVAGHGLTVIKGLPPLVLTEDDVDEFADALDDDQGRAADAASLTRFALKAARAGIRRLR